MKRRSTFLIIIAMLAIAGVSVWMLLHQPEQKRPIAVQPAAKAQPEAVQPEAEPPVDRAPPLPTIAAEQIELHGTLAGEPYWARLLVVDKTGTRVMQLVYTPPKSEELAGTVLRDCPFLRVDANLRLLAWDGREGLSQIQRVDQPPGYLIEREVATADAEDQALHSKRRTIGAPLAWDLRLAPILVAMSWKAKTSAAVRLIDFYGPRIAERLVLSWKDAEVVIAGQRFTAVDDGNGGLKRLMDPEGKVVLDVAGRP